MTRPDTAQPATPLDPLALPLHGSRLIEASAGTGKTYTIATLYVRLVLGHGGPHAFARPLAPPEILVVTFTDAATQELRDRIRARLVQAAQGFDDAQAAAALDPLLAALRESYAPDQWPACAHRLRLAAEWMDEAAVSTIHGWCYRMLREHAFDSGSLFRQELLTDEQALLEQAVRDYWRRHFYPLPPAAAAEVLKCHASPEALGQALRPLLARDEALFTAGGVPLERPGSLEALLGDLQQWTATREAQLLHTRELWAGHEAELRALLIDLRAHLNGNTFREKGDDARFEAWLDALAHWARSGEGDDTLKLHRLAPSRLKLNGKRTLPPHAAFAAIEALTEHEQTRPDIAPGLLLHALNAVRQALAREKERRAELGFDDLLARLARALDGEQGEVLAVSIRQHFPVALIDEFQDTDPLQYRIFERVYAPAMHAGMDSASCGTGLLLIGDPKQAIYAFRGADIHTYLRARETTAGRHDTLGTNYRSTEAMVAAVNHCFGYAETHHTRGAFRFARADGDNPVPFVPVAANGRPERLELAGQPASALTAWLLQPEPGEGASVIGTARYRDEMAERSASAVRGWLADARTGRAGLRQADGTLKPLRPADIAILVRGRSEAEAVRQALARRQLASVYLSDRDSVFRSREAADVLWWLQACADPSHDARLRAALATTTMGWSWQALDRLNEDELYWEALVQRCQDYRRIWQRQGVLPMLRRWLADFDVAAHLLAQPDGERSLTNVLHVAEWLQHQGMEMDREHALIRALADKLAQPAQEEILRLESDADLIKVVTIHKSKGLEYPLVLLPFISGWKEVDTRASAVAFHADAQETAPAGYTVELSRDKTSAAPAVERANDERLSENMRLLYVALTRARHAVWLGVAPLASGGGKTCELHKGALGYMLAGGAAIDAADLPARLADWRQGCADIVVEPAPPADDAVLPPVAAPALGPARQAQGQGFERWWIASYSALRAGSELTPDHDAEAAERAEPISVQEEDLRESNADAAWVAAATAAATVPRAGSRHAFPKGAEAGSFLHGLLELAAAQGFAQAHAQPQALREAIARRCAPRGWQSWIDPLANWLGALLGTRLPLPGAEPAALADVGPYQSEMEFWFAAAHVDTRALDRLVSRHTLGGAARPALLPEQLNGMLKGYMDLVFEADGRYYIADYKSNWLGADEAAYTDAALRQAMLAHRYDLQYALYTLALHRLLRSRLADYDYERHVGGVLYLFMRGIGAVGQGVYAERPARALVEALDALFSNADGEVTP
ncbi:MAG: RecBCD enzyme subunit RecB [Paracidovorax wautersii]|uniref:RecBCD enzyme subunit RecB n=1 Tax=Paracidovorax wautersii TaxID=1177982 RepID=A0A7V8FM73_9BURK|nr:MAG: RecBCD enzyme subunit RecB [Paracidovorax wautersii]